MGVNTSQIRAALGQPKVAAIAVGLAGKQKTLKLLQKIAIGLFVSIFLGFIAFFLKATGVIGKEEFSIPLFFGLFFGIFGVVAFFFFLFFRTNSLNHAFAEGIVAPVLTHLYSDYTFNGDGGIPREVYIESGLYDDHFTGYTTSNLLTGSHNHINFELCQLHVTITKSTGTGKNRSTSTTDIFKGVFVRFDTALITLAMVSKKKKISLLGLKLSDGRTNSTLFDRVGKTAVPTNNTELDEKYDLYAMDHEQITELLTHQRANQLQAALERIGKTVQIGLDGGTGYIAIEGSEWLTHNSCDFGQLQTHFEQYDAFLENIFAIMDVFEPVVENKFEY